jgi:hypothetical protein
MFVHAIGRAGFLSLFHLKRYARRFHVNNSGAVQPRFRRKAGEAMRITEITFDTTFGAAEEWNFRIPSGISRRVREAAGLALITILACLVSGCSTGPGSTTNQNPPIPSWLVTDQTTRSQPVTVTPAGSSITEFINPGDDYVVTFQATSASGIKSISLSGSGEVICHDNKAPYSEGKPFKFTIPAQTIALSPQPGGQVFTQGLNPFFFFWSPTQGEPAANEPAASAFTACGSQVPLLGTTTYTGQATTVAGVSNPANNLSVTTCAAGLPSSPSATCP